MAKDLELFSQHAGRKSVNMEDVILSGKFTSANKLVKLPLSISIVPGFDSTVVFNV